MRLTFLEAGEVVTTHGVRGEVKVLPWVDSPEFLCGFHRARIDGTEYKVERCRVQKTCALVKLRGVDTVEQAQTLRGRTLEVYREDAPAGAVFAAELMDMEVFCKGQLLGRITDVLDYPANQVYVVTGEHEYLIPAVRQFVLDTDLEKNVMQVNVIEGMRSDES